MRTAALAKALSPDRWNARAKGKDRLRRARVQNITMIAANGSIIRVQGRDHLALQECPRKLEQRGGILLAQVHSSPGFGHVQG
ncbi:MAG: hypothetical protein IPI01_08205 [Ignavibacteriae bacterium]|nr:hypothetical protein [Ignavibacteriota bacterium]